MSAKYLIRLDDACPTMDKKKWDELETLLDKYNVKPIVAVVPSNMDELLNIDEADNKFWNKVRTWQQKQWTIALHGFDHRYTTRSSGIVPFNNDSEFAGVDIKLQEEKIEKGIEILRKEGIETETFVAPSHSFDFNTLKALKAKSNINIISDGLAVYPYYYKGFYWIPQQLWSCKKMPFGVWTICLHPNAMDRRSFDELTEFLERECRSIIAANEIQFKKRSRNILDILFGKYLISKINRNRRL